MDIYKQKSRWKIFLLIGGIIILIISMLYTSYLADELKEGERSKMELYVKAVQSLNDNISDEDMSSMDITLQTDVISANNSIPIIWVDEMGNVLEAKNFPESRLEDMAYLKKELVGMVNSGIEPIEIRTTEFVQYIYYKHSIALTLLTYFPFFQIGLLGSFILIGYLGFSYARKAEQNRVWVGLAKETAHQLGTPISAIMGWVEYLDTTIAEEDDENRNIIEELRKDIQRLELVADRFSKIGSSPDLTSLNIYEELENCKEYMEKRSPKNVVFNFPKPEMNPPILVNINRHLFNWVLENLMRNALDAMDGRGEISARIHLEGEYVMIDISDTGKGIPPSSFKRVFEPGYSTKTRGWGLGLSLSKRIIDNYHEGRIFVKSSVVNSGTTFCIRLKKVG